MRKAGGWHPPKICVIEKLGSSLLRMSVVFLQQYGDTEAQPVWFRVEHEHLHSVTAALAWAACACHVTYQ